MPGEFAAAAVCSAVEAVGVAEDGAERSPLALSQLSAGPSTSRDSVAKSVNSCACKMGH